ncbi:MAG: UvrD-helicase domain-containing protein [Phycisphaerae bacterium]|jgi:ATP-dependent helicase/nuclease subunit A|nr:UvrD-helicase domain-containing protein [Phycisphaerae bacterium]
MSELQLTDPQRKAAIDCADQSMALRSGAGCGKTFVLARRYTQLLTGPQDDSRSLRSLVALTFTDKAAIEMSQRVGMMLSEQAQQTSGPQRAQFRRWIDELPEARISTIHSFCASLLRAHAVEAGVDPSFAVCADDLLVTKLLEEACDSAMLAAAEAGDPQLSGLLEYLSYPGVVELLTKLVSERHLLDTEAYRNPMDVLTAWRELLDRQRQAAWGRLDNDQRLADLARNISGQPCDDPKDKLLAKRQHLMPVINAIITDPTARTPEKFAFACKFTVGNVGGKAGWGSREAAMDLRHRIKKLKELLEPYAPYAETLNEMDEVSAKSLVALTSLAGDAGQRYAAAKRGRGLLDFNDLIVHASGLIRTNPDLRNQIASGIDQLLIDECQDTDAFQLQMLADLVSGDGGDAPKTFVVGDAKQSIYRFRGADVEEFESTCNRLGQGRSESLDMSFRTHGAGLEFVNSLFAPLMGDSYETMNAHRSEIPPHESVEILLADGDEPITRSEEASEAQAALTAQRISEMITGGEKLVWDSHLEAWRAVQPRDIAILLSRMTHSLEYERQLQKHNVPYYVVAGTGFFKQQEVFDILNALRIIDNPLDDIALFGVLRSSLVSLDDNALMHITETLAGGPYLLKLATSAIDNLVGKLTGDQLNALRFAVALVQRLSKRKNAIAIDELMAELLEETGYLAVLASQFGAKRLVGNIRQLTDRAAAADRDGMSLRDFITSTDQLILSESRYEQAVVAGENDNVVRLMTVHKAKGLEFGVLVLPDLNAGRRGFVGRLMHRGRDWGWTLNVKPDPDEPDSPEDAEPLSFRLAKLAENDDLCAEDIRKLYVAITRHRDHLVLIGANMRDRNSRISSSTSPLAQIDEILHVSDAIDSGAETIGYGDGQFKARVARIVPSPPGNQTGPEPPGRKAISRAARAEDLAAAMLVEKSNTVPPPVLIGPLAASVGSVETAVTALSEFAHCPMLYRWRYELAVPSLISPPRPAPISPQPGGGISLDALTLGTLYHKCMEMLDFSNPHANQELIARVVWEMDLDDAVNQSALTDELDDMISRFAKHDLWKSLASARHIHRELDFVLTAGQLTLRGQIDLLYCDDQGSWHVVDYKSDRVSNDNRIAQRAENYRLQMLAYSIAAGRHLNQPVADASLYFLRLARQHTFTIDRGALQGAQARLSALTEDLITARRTNQFPRLESDHCVYCPYSTLCDRLSLDC